MVIFVVRNDSATRPELTSRASRAEHHTIGDFGALLQLTPRVVADRWLYADFVKLNIYRDREVGAGGERINFSETDVMAEERNVQVEFSVVLDHSVAANCNNFTSGYVFDLYDDSESSGFVGNRVRVFAKLNY